MRKHLLGVAVLLALGCERSSSGMKTDSVSAHTASTTNSGFSYGFKFPVVDPSDPFYENIEAPDSSVQAWHFAHPTNMSADTFFGGSYIRHPSGLFILWLDTASRATEETPSRRVHADSVVVQGLKPGEMIARYCRYDGGAADRFVGIIADTTPAHPRVAWMLDPLKVRITSFAADSLTCRATAPNDDGDVDPDD